MNTCEKAQMGLFFVDAKNVSFLIFSEFAILDLDKPDSAEESGS